MIEIECERNEEDEEESNGEDRGEKGSEGERLICGVRRRVREVWKGGIREGVRMNEGAKEE